MDTITLIKHLNRIAGLAGKADKSSLPGDEVSMGKSVSEMRKTEHEAPKVPDMKESPYRIAKVNRRKRMAAMEEEVLKQVPGFSPSQIHNLVDQCVKASDTLETFMAQHGQVINEYLRMQTADEAAKTALKTALKHINRKGNFLMEGKSWLLKFQAVLQSKVPGIEQMMADASPSPGAEKAGELLKKVAEKMGKQVADGVGEIIQATKEDLTHISQIVKSIKILQKAKTSSVRTAGVSALIDAIKLWLSGEVDATTHRVIGFAGDIWKWLKGFAVRTGDASAGLEKIKAALARTEDALKNV